jgi:hypothetical protein
VAFLRAVVGRHQQHAKHDGAGMDAGIVERQSQEEDYGGRYPSQAGGPFMITRADIQWFKEQFAADIAPALAGTPFTVDFLVAIACQETGHIWSSLRHTSLSVDEILATCVGDVIDAPGRKAFPVSKAALLAEKRGDEMFAIARKGLELMSGRVGGFQKAVSQPHKFCRGFGIFQYDLQHFRADPAYFLEQRYLSFPASLEKALGELRAALKRVKLANRASLTDLELCSVAIAYNRGSFEPSRGLKQGHFDGKRFYGEHIFDFLRLSQSAPGTGVPPQLAPPPPGTAALPPPTPLEAEGTVFEVDVRDSPLRLRSAPVKSDANIIARLPDGQRVQAVAAKAVKGFLEVETSVNGARLRGFAAREFLVPLPADAAVPIAAPAPTPPASGVVAVVMPRHPGTVTRRTGLANAHSLNEPNQPERAGTTPSDLRREIDAIVDYLAVDRATHRRYQPRDGLTFCNIYAHDFCHLAGVYLPRVWWTPPAIEKLARGETVEPQLGKTITEQRANAIFGWLRDFGLRFGWRQTGSLTKLQAEVNEGAIGLIIARRTDNERPGHVTVIVPETGAITAKRAASGDVIAPLQSQAGTTNFRRSPGKAEWWRGTQFAEHAFWLHA